jgi:hypothetical protein
LSLVLFSDCDITCVLILLKVCGRQAINLKFYYGHQNYYLSTGSYSRDIYERVL